jgi:hypothetical protein
VVVALPVKECVVVVVLGAEPLLATAGVWENTVVIQSMAVLLPGVGKVCPLVESTTPGGMVKWVVAETEAAAEPAAGAHAVGITEEVLLLLILAMVMFWLQLEWSNYNCLTPSFRVQSVNSTLKATRK